MNHDLILTFCDPITKENEIEIPFTLTGSDISWRWLGYLYDTIHVKGMVAKNNRWSNFTPESPQQICDRINQTVDVCRKYHPELFVDLCAKPEMTQEHYNWMHTYFEKYRGEMFNQELKSIKMQ